MNFFYLTLAAAPFVLLALALNHIAGLTRKKAEVQRAFGDWRLPAIGEDIIAMLDEVDSGNRRDIYFDRDATDREILREYLPDVYSETKLEIVKSRNLKLYSLFVGFAALWWLVWLKSWALPSRRDLRALVGFEVLICQRARS